MVVLGGVAVSSERGTSVTLTSLTGADMEKALLESDVRERMSLSLNLILVY
jgi:hypothetical protein